MVFDKWTLLKVFEVGFVISCLICKRVTDDEASRLFLYLQKLSREWSLLNNVTWDKLGAAVADTTYGGYIIITFALLMGRIAGELPTPRRVMEIIFLGIGTVLFVIIGSLVFASLDSVPPDLVDNAAVLGTLSLITGALFLLDLGGPKANKTGSESSKKISRTSQTPANRNEVYDIEPDLAKIERKEIEALEEQHKQRTKPLKEQNGYKGGQNGHGPKTGSQTGITGVQHGYKKMKEVADPTRRFDIYGKDGEDETDGDEKRGEAQEMEEHSPVWSQIRKGQYGKYDIAVPSYLQYITPDAPTAHQESHPSSPGDPGYVQYTASRWGQPGQKTPRHSPTTQANGTNRKRDPYSEHNLYYSWAA